ncbi:hypothetical protein ACIBCT_18760 [Streptosporangium sp. NPDC050855]|uniref:hypothetical protein n=1 Tax=Streptosporangium sp. NPDC050855 TaxID=3366194 RepID=UPI0037BB7E93
MLEGGDAVHFDEQFLSLLKKVLAVTDQSIKTSTGQVVAALIGTDSRVAVGEQLFQQQ